MVDNLSSMLDAYASVMDGQDHLSVSSGYLSYEQVLDQYVNASKEFAGVNNYMYGAGKNEQQLGYTIDFRWSKMSG